MLVTQDAYVYDELLWCTNLTLPVFSINYPEKPIRVRHSVLTSSVEGGGAVGWCVMFVSKEFERETSGQFFIHTEKLWNNIKVDCRVLRSPG